MVEAHIVFSYVYDLDCLHFTVINGDFILYLNSKVYCSLPLRSTAITAYNDYNHFC